MSYVDALESGGGSRHPIEEEIRASVPSGIGRGGIAGKGSAVGQTSEISIVIGSWIVVLIALRVDADGDRMESALPGQIVNIGVRVIDQAAAKHGDATSSESADTLVGKPVEGLIRKS